MLSPLSLQMTKLCRMMSSNIKALRCRTLKCSILPRSSVSGSGRQQRQIRAFTDGSGGLGSRTGCARTVSSDDHHSTPSSCSKYWGVGRIRKNACICLLLSEHQMYPLLNKRTGISGGGGSFPENWLSEDWLNSTVGTSEEPVGLC